MGTTTRPGRRERCACGVRRCRLRCLSGRLLRGWPPGEVPWCVCAAYKFTSRSRGCRRVHVLVRLLAFAFAVVCCADAVASAANGAGNTRRRKARKRCVRCGWSIPWAPFGAWRVLALLMFSAAVGHARAGRALHPHDRLAPILWAAPVVAVACAHARAPTAFAHEL
jgi:hypothetical protein